MTVIWVGWVTSFFKEVLIHFISIRNCLNSSSGLPIFSWDEAVHYITRKRFCLSRFGQFFKVLFLTQKIFKDLSQTKKKFSLHICAKITHWIFLAQSVSFTFFNKWQKLDIGTIYAIYMESCLRWCFIIYWYSFPSVIGKFPNKILWQLKINISCFIWSMD